VSARDDRAVELAKQTICGCARPRVQPYLDNPASLIAYAYATWEETTRRLRTPACLRKCSTNRRRPRR
jgi:hypothetical protein